MMTKNRAIILFVVALLGIVLGTLAMLYAYRDESESLVNLMFEMVSPSSFYSEDLESYGFNQDTDEVKETTASLFGIMLDSDITKEQIENPESVLVAGYSAGVGGASLLKNMENYYIILLLKH